jgi:hypothetical protein
VRIACAARSLVASVTTIRIVVPMALQALERRPSEPVRGSVEVALITMLRR